MAKKAKKRSSGGGRRRRMGAIGGDLSVILFAIGGAVLGKFASTKFLANMDSKIVGAAQGILGFLLNKQANPMLKGLGLGLAVSGGLTIAQGFGIISGIGAPIVLRTSRVAGYKDVPSINGYKDVANVNGVDDFDYSILGASGMGLGTTNWNY